MLKKLILISGVCFVFSTNLFANECNISDELLEKKCSSEFITVRNSRELSDYLIHGKFKNGELLNLDIGFDIKEKSIEIAVSCNLQVLNKKLTASKDGICLKANNITIKNKSTLSTDKKAPINIVAENSIFIKNSSIIASGELTMTTKILLPFDNELNIDKGSELKASKISLNSKSNLILDSDSKLKSNSIILNGGSCEIFEENDARDKRHSNKCKPFKPKLTYQGTCKLQSLDSNIKIESKLDQFNSQKVTFNLKNVPAEANLIWRIDNTAESVDKTVVNEFIFPGRHLIQAVVFSNNGQFIRISNLVDSYPNKLNNSQMAIFQFVDLVDAPRKISIFIDLQKYELIKSDSDPELYYLEITGNKNKEKSILIPELKYAGKFNFVILPVIKNSKEYIDSKIDEVKSILEVDRNSYLNTTLLSILDLLSADIQKLSLKDKNRLAEKIQANWPENISDDKVTHFNPSNYPEKFERFLGGIVSTAYAQSVPNPDMHDQIATQQMRTYKDANIRLVKKGIGLLIIGLGFSQYPGDVTLSKIIAALGIGFGLAIINKEFSIMARVINSIYRVADIFELELNTFFTSGEESSVYTGGRLVTVNESEDGNRSLLFRQLFATHSSFNATFDSANSKINKINNFLSYFGFYNAIPVFGKLTFHKYNFRGNLSASLVNVKVLSSEFGDVILSNVSRTFANMNLTFKASKTQTAKVEIKYENKELGSIITVIKEVRVVALTTMPAAAISFNIKNLQVNFSADVGLNDSGYTYIWNFGDGTVITTTSKSISHTYDRTGVWPTSLEVRDSNGNSVYAFSEVRLSSVPTQVAEIGHYSQGLTANIYSPVSYYNSARPVVIYNWDFGDGTIFSEELKDSKFYTHTYTSQGKYKVTLEVVNGDGGIIASKKEIDIFIVIPVARTVSGPTQMITSGNSFKYTYACDIDESLFEGNSLTYIYESHLSSENISCSGDGVTEVNENVIYENNCQTVAYKNTEWYSQHLANNPETKPYDGSSYCPIGGYMGYESGFICKVRDPNGLIHESNYVQDYYTIDFSEIRSCI